MTSSSNDISLYDILYPYQKRFIDAPQRKKLFLSSRQIGKSFAIAYAMCKEVLVKPRSVGLCISTGERAAGELLAKVKAMAEAIRLVSRGKIRYTTNATTVSFNNGSKIHSLPSNPDGLRGYTAAVVAIDECAFIQRAEECWNAILPTLSRDPTSKLFVTSTPAGQSGLFYDLYTKSDDSWYIQKTTIEDAVSEGYPGNLEKLRNDISDPDAWAREYMCLFDKEYGVMMDFEKLDFYDELPKVRFKGKYLGIDVGRTSDSTAITEILEDESGCLYLDNVIQLFQKEYRDQFQIVKELHQAKQFSSGYVDMTGIGSAFAEQIQKEISSRIVGLQFTEANKTPMYEKVRSLIYDHKLKFNSKFKTQLKEDFANVHRVVTESGKVRFEAGRYSKGHSDIISSLVLAVKSRDDSPANFEQPRPHTNFSAFGYRSSRLR